MKLLSTLLFVFLILFFQQSIAETGGVRELLFDTLRPVLSESLQENKKVILYCPDNLCLSVESSGDVDAELLYEFSIMYFFYEADFPEFREKDYLLPTGVNPRSKFENVAPSLLDKYKSNCCKEDVQDKSTCVLRHLRDKHGIKTYFSRLDEGYFTKEEVRE